MKRVKFYKYQGAGNDFILFNDSHLKLDHLTKEKIQQLCDRHYGIGSDGLIILKKSRIAKAKMNFFNPDGQEATFCGNASRCVVRHLDQQSVSIETSQGIMLGRIEETQVAVMLPKAEEVFSPMAVDGDRIGHLFDTGVPHLVIQVDDIDSEDFVKRAQSLRYSKLFIPNGVNVSYIKEVDGKMMIRTYERGVEGETLSCGTACAATALLMRKNDNKKKSQYTVYPKSLNPLQFTFDNQDNIWMKGNAVKVFEGEISL